jgi:hypothetical protein
MIVAQRRAVIPEPESPVVAEPMWHVPVAMDAHVVMTRRVVAIVGAVVCRCDLGGAQTKAANNGKGAD